MPLTNVWTRDSNGEWIRTTAVSTDKSYQYSVSADSRHFRCYSCFQYVSFVKGSKTRISHFKHSAGYSDKDCEDRTFNTNNAYTYTSVASMNMPMRLALDGSRIMVSVGFLPVRCNELKKCVANNLQVTISGSQGVPTVYRVDWNRFAPNATTWLDVPPSGIDKLKIDFSPSASKPKLWSGVVAEIPSTGALFDVKTGRRMPDKGDVVACREYYLLLRRGRWISHNPVDVQVTKLNTSDTLWNVYRIRALRFSEAASDFFFNYLRVRLTNYPVEMSVIWPPVLEKDEMIETNYRNIKLIVKGEADFSTYPQYSSSCTAMLLRDNAKLLDIRSSGPLQMVTSERYNHTLQFMYIRPMERESCYMAPKVEVSFDDEQPCTENVLRTVPLRGILHFFCTDDGYIDVYQNNAFYYRKSLLSGEKTRITEIKRNSRICIYVGLELLAELKIAPQAHKGEVFKLEALENWHGRNVPFPKKYAWVLELMDKQSELYRRTLLALNRGEIPLDGWNAIQMMMEGR